MSSAYSLTSALTAVRKMLCSLTRFLKWERMDFRKTRLNVNYLLGHKHLVKQIVMM